MFRVESRPHGVCLYKVVVAARVYGESFLYAAGECTVAVEFVAASAWHLAIAGTPMSGHCEVRESDVQHDML